jgi:hypothetical protein
MSSDALYLLYSMRDVLAEAWCAYWAVMLVVIACLVIELGRHRRVHHEGTSGARRGPVDLWTIPIMVVSVRMVGELHRIVFSSGGHFPPPTAAALVWLTASAGFVAIGAAVVIVAVATLVGHALLGSRVRLTPTLGWPALAGLLSVAAICSLLWAVLDVVMATG